MEQNSPIVCNICLNSMVEPRILPCMHSFCLKCLEYSTISRDRPKCPTCQIEFQIPEGGLKNLKKNEFIEQLNSFKQVNINCDCCKSKEAAQFCVECSYNYCSNCLIYHGKSPASRNHHLQATTKGIINNDKYPMCNEHSEIMTLFCENCNVVLCGHCLILKHKNHSLKHLSDYCESVRRKLMMNIKLNELLIKNVAASYKTSETTLHENEAKALNLENEIQQRVDELRNIFHSTVAELNKPVREELERHKNKADDVMKELKSLELNLNSQNKTLWQQLKNLNFENAVETSSCIVEDNDNDKTIIPKYTELFDYKLLHEIKEIKINFEKMVKDICKVGGSTDLKKNEFIEQSNIPNQSIVTCDACNANQAIGLCVDGSLSYCSSCLVQAATTTKEKIITKKYPICKEHSDVMNLFCEGGGVIVCGLCVALNHNSHCVKHVSQYFEYVKFNIGKNLRKHEDIVEDVVANYKNYQATMESNEAKASDLKKKIQERGEDLKKVVDSIVDELIENVDKELKRLHDEADDVLKELKNMETNLNAQIESLKQQLSFNVVFLAGINQPIKTLKGTFGTLNKVTGLKKACETTMRCTFASMTLKDGDVYLCKYPGSESIVSALDHKSWNHKKSYYFEDELTDLSDIVIINNTLFVAGRSNQSNDIVRVAKFHIKSDNAPLKICDIQSEGDVLRLSKSFDGNLLLVLSDKILQLSANGDIMKTINLSFNICDALQIGQHRYVVCCETELCIIDQNGLKIVTYSPPNECCKISSPFRLAKDNFRIFVSDKTFPFLYVVDYNLNFLNFHNIGGNALKMYFDETRMALIILTNTPRIIDYELKVIPMI